MTGILVVILTIRIILDLVKKSNNSYFFMGVKENSVARWDILIFSAHIIGLIFIDLVFDIEGDNEFDSTVYTIKIAAQAFWQLLLIGYTVQIRPYTHVMKNIENIFSNLSYFVFLLFLAFSKEDDDWDYYSEIVLASLITSSMGIYCILDFTRLMIVLANIFYKREASQVSSKGGKTNQPNEEESKLDKTSKPLSKHHPSSKVLKCVSLKIYFDFDITVICQHQQMRRNKLENNNLDKFILKGMSYEQSDWVHNIDMIAKFKRFSVDFSYFLIQVKRRKFNFGDFDKQELAQFNL
jgi:hypothetical protein